MLNLICIKRRSHFHDIEEVAVLFQGFIMTTLNKKNRFLEKKSVYFPLFGQIALRRSVAGSGPFKPLHCFVTGMLSVCLS
jgi:hypothetical protein